MRFVRLDFRSGGAGLGLPIARWIAEAHGRQIVLESGNSVYRLPAVSSLDARVEKMFAFRRTQVAFDVDVFNLLNSGTVLGRVYDVNSSKFDQVAEIMNPRIVRFGLRVQF